ncbi:MAG: response regulator [Nitrospirae bacterium]|nr:response regulator [Nitrospirota bacterium]
MEERKKRRVIFQKDVIINGAIKGYALDISEAGMYIHSLADFVPGAVVDLDFDISGKRINVKSGIQHIESGIGIGVKFLNLNKFPENIMLIKALIYTKTKAPLEHSKKVLVADANSQTKEIYKNRLLQDGFLVHEAENGLQAFRTLQQIRPDIVVLDPHLDKVDGFKLMQIMRANPELKRIPVVIVSSRILPEEIDKAVSLGAKEYLIKSTTTPIKLSETIKRILKEVK